MTALRRIRGILRPGGILRPRDLAFDVEPDDVEQTVEAWMAFAADDPPAGYTAPQLAAHVRNGFGTFTWLLEPLLEHAGFEILDRQSRVATYVAYTCRRIG